MTATCNSVSVTCKSVRDRCGSATDRYESATATCNSVSSTCKSVRDSYSSVTDRYKSATDRCVPVAATCKCVSDTYIPVTDRCNSWQECSSRDILLQAHELTKQIVMLNAVKYLFNMCPFIRDASWPQHDNVIIKSMQVHEFIKQSVIDRMNAILAILGWRKNAALVCVEAFLCLYSRMTCLKLNQRLSIFLLLNKQDYSIY